MAPRTLNAVLLGGEGVACARETRYASGFVFGDHFGVFIGVQQPVDGSGVVRFQTEYPTGAVGILIHQFRLLAQVLIDLHDLTGERAIQVRGGFHRLDHGTVRLCSILQSHLRQLDVDHVAECILRVVGDADPDRAIRQGLDPFVAGGVFQVFRNSAHRRLYSFARQARRDRTADYNSIPALHSSLSLDPAGLVYLVCVPEGSAAGNPRFRPPAYGSNVGLRVRSISFRLGAGTANSTLSCCGHSCPGFGKPEYRVARSADVELIESIPMFRMVHINPSLVCWAWLLLLMLLSIQAEAIALTGERPVVSLNGRWQVIVDPYAAGYYDMHGQPRRDGYFLDAKPETSLDLVEYDFDRSIDLAVPGDWNSQRDDLLFYEGSVWYKRTFAYSLPMGRRLFLRFGAVNYLARVYLNGQALGEHRGGFTPFVFEITGKTRSQHNVLIVQVDNRRELAGVPGPMTDWWNYGGLTRDVDLIETPQVYIDDYFLQLQPGRRDRVAGWVRIDGARATQHVRVDIPAANIRYTLVTDARGYATFEFPAALRLWSPPDPHRYEISLGTVADRVADHIGFRSIERSGARILLNGQPIFLRGVALHEEAPMRGGRASRPEDATTLLGWAAELGANFVRLAHYPHNAAMVAEAERRGLMVWAEIPVYWTLAWRDPQTLALAGQQLTELIARDKNRAAVIFWTVGNETPLSSARTAFMRTLVHSARRQDPTRLITSALMYHNRQGTDQRIVNLVDDPLGADLDVLAVNEYIGWYDGPPSAARRTLWRTTYAKPLLFSEFGADAKYGRRGGILERWTEDYQENVYREQFAMFDRMPNLSGIVPWVLNDFRSPRRPLPGIQDYFNRKGLVSERGEKKRAFFALQAYYAQRVHDRGQR
jgi:beta-glucuronidase